MAARKKAPAPPPEGIPVNPNPSDHLPRIATLYQSIQRDRVGLKLSLDRKPDTYDAMAWGIYSKLEELEKTAVDYLKTECIKVSIYPWIVAQRGLSDRLAGMLIGLIDIRRADTVSALWRYAGQAVTFICPGGPCSTEERHSVNKEGVAKVTIGKVPFVSFTKENMDGHMLECKLAKKALAAAAEAGTTILIEGHAERRIKGAKLHYNDVLKKTCYLVGRQFLMNGHPLYEPIYRSARAEYDRTRPLWPDGRRHNAARRKMVKLFLSHLWTVWRAAENLPVRAPYAQTLPGHERGYIAPVPASVAECTGGK